MPEPFLIDVYGPFAPGQVHVRWVDEPRPARPVLDALVARVWEEQTRACRQSGRLLFNGRLVRYLRHQVVDGVLAIDVGPTDYANLLATNLLNWQRGEELGWHLFSNAVGSSALPITSDGRLLLGRRNQRVAFHAGYVHVIGGGLEAVDCRDDGTAALDTPQTRARSIAAWPRGVSSVDAFAAARRELLEELALASQEIGDVLCLGMIRDPTIMQPELIFDAHVNLTWDEIAGRLDPGDAHQEHAELLACPDQPDAVLSFIRSNRPITPVAVGLLCLHGRRCFGEGWYERTVGQLLTCR